MIIISKWLTPKGYLGITLFPFIVLKTATLKKNTILINHEQIHLRQQIELLIFPFFIIYIVEFLIKLYLYKNWHKAYLNISFEREAYKHQNNLHYLKNRTFWEFLKYIRSYDC